MPNKIRMESPTRRESEKEYSEKNLRLVIPKLSCDMHGTEDAYFRGLFVKLSCLGSICNDANISVK